MGTATRGIALSTEIGSSGGAEMVSDCVYAIECWGLVLIPK